MTVGAMNLDARQRAMLEEMGVKVWWPSAESAHHAAVPATATGPMVRAAATPSRQAPQATAAVMAEAARLPAVTISASAHGASVLADEPRRVDAGATPAKGGWLIVADMPPELDGRHGDPFGGDAGRLLDQMLRALHLRGDGVAVHLVRTHRGVASGQPDSPRPIAEAIEQAASTLVPRVVFAMGPLAAQSLLQSGEPLGKLRSGTPRRSAVAGLSDVPVVASYHPAYLLRNPADKARAWSDLCLAAEQLSISP